MRLFSPAALLGALLLGGCSAADTAREALPGVPLALSEAEARWAASGIRSYDLVFRTICLCVPDQPYTLKVRNGQAVSFTSGSGKAQEGRYAPAVDSLFAWARRAEATTGMFDARRGFPTDLLIDYDRRMADDEVRYLVLSFVAR